MTIKKIIAPLILLGLMPGCMKQTKFKPQQVKPLTKQSATYEETNNGITLRVKQLDSYDCEKLFGNNAKNLFKGKKTLCPIQLSIENKQSKEMILDTENIDLSLADNKIIAKRLHSSAFLFSPGIIGAGGLCILPLLLPFVDIGCLGCCCSILPIIVGIPVLGALVATPFVVSYAIIRNAVTSRNSNRKINTDIQQKVIGNQIVIKPNETRNVLLFVEEKNYRPDFSLALINQDNQEEKTAFNVKL